MRSPNPRSKGPPHNPGLGEFVSRIRDASEPLSQSAIQQGFRGWHERGYLPHRDQPGLIQLVTFRLADSFPTSMRSEWAHLYEIEDDQERREQLESYLDQGRGACHLRRPDIAKLMEDTLLFFHAKRYTLLAWVVMPNHGHVQLKVEDIPLSKIVQSWKRHVAREANKLLGKQGPFWAEDYWDTYMRDMEHELRARRYVENNPAKAGLVPDARTWPWSSARFRDEYDRLNL